MASAPFAQPFYNGANVLPAPPNTEVWIALYVQVHKADKTAMRNIELDKRRRQVNSKRDLGIRTGLRPREQMAEVRWSDATLDSLLLTYGLDPSSPLSVLAVELLPEPNGGLGDPLGGDLGDVRVLRTSPLSPVQTVCC